MVIVQPEVLYTGSMKPVTVRLRLISVLQPGDPRPNAFNAVGGGLDLRLLTGSIPAPSAEVLAKELAVFRRLAAATPAPDMEASQRLSS